MEGRGDQRERAHTTSGTRAAVRSSQAGSNRARTAGSRQARAAAEEARAEKKRETKLLLVQLVEAEAVEEWVLVIAMPPTPKPPPPSILPGIIPDRPKKA